MKDDIFVPQNGMLLFDDDFNKAVVSTLPWFMTTATTGAGIALDSTAGLWSSGGQTMKYASGTQAGSSAEIHRYFTKKAGADSFFFGGRFHIADSANPSNLGFYLGFRDGVNWIRGKILVTTAGAASWVDAANVNQSIVSRALNASATRARWHEFFLQVDFANKEYEAVTFDEVVANQAAARQALRSTADATVPNAIDFAIDDTDTAVAGAIYYDRLWGGYIL